MSSQCCCSQNDKLKLVSHSKIKFNDPQTYTSILTPFSISNGSTVIFDSTTASTVTNLGQNPENTLGVKHNYLVQEILFLGDPTNPTQLANMSNSNDHVKYLWFTKPTTLGDKQIFVSEMKFSTRINDINLRYDTSDHKVGAYPGIDRNDIRLGAGSLVTLETNVLLTADFFISNNAIYTLYERLPNGLPPAYSSFTSLKYICERKTNQIDKLAVKWDKFNSTIEWLIDGKIVARVDNPGLIPNYTYSNGKIYNTDFFPTYVTPYGSVPDKNTDSIIINSIVTGPGMFTLMDNRQIDNFSNGLLELNPDQDYLYPSRFYHKGPGALANPTNYTKSLDPTPVQTTLVDPGRQGGTLHLYNLKLSVYQHK